MKTESWLMSFSALLWATSGIGLAFQGLYNYMFFSYILAHLSYIKFGLIQEAGE